MELRKANSKDYVELRNLWQEVFRDSAEYIDYLYESLDAIGYVLLNKGNVVSCLTIFDVGDYEGKTITEIYAVCTKAYDRGKGYASKLIEHAKSEIEKSGKIAMICPASEELIAFYQKLNFAPQFYTSMDFSDFEKNAWEATKYKTPQEYSEIREDRLSKIPHIKINLSFLEFVVNEKEYESLNIKFKDAYAVQGMINKDSGLLKRENEYPYFGFPMK